MINPQPYSTLFTQSGRQKAKVTICVSLYNYQDYIVEALESVYAQTLHTLDLIVVEDCSTDWSATVAQVWFEQRHERFNTVQLIQHQKNSGLSAARNTALSLAETPFVFILDADNLLYPRCIAQCLEAIEASDAAFIYPMIEKFGNSPGIMGSFVWNRERLAQENYIDAMALLRKSVIVEIGGYTPMPLGWEDYDLWCKLSETGHYGVLVPEILARYRTHEQSMLNTTTRQEKNVQILNDEMMKRHPWLQLNN